MTDLVYIVTLKLDASSFAALQALRVRHFPAAINWIAAHVTLLHTVSAGQLEQLLAGRSTLEATHRLPMNYSTLRFLGRGVAIGIDAPRVSLMRHTLMTVMGGEFTRQDQQAFRAHVTVQNKVDPALARKTFDELNRTFVPWSGEAHGLSIHRYLGGPWEAVQDIEFTPWQ